MERLPKPNPTGNPTGNRQATDTDKNVKNVRSKKDGDFGKSLISLLSEIESEFSTEDLQHKENFLNYWTEMNPGGRKQRWELERVFDVKRRFQTWLRNHKRWTGQMDADRKAKILDSWGQNQ
jgi:hypothetical protein